MTKCANKNCKNDPLESDNAICVNEVGDFVCNKSCKKEYEKQIKQFIKNIIDDDDDDVFLDDFSGLDMSNPYD